MATIPQPWLFSWKEIDAAGDLDRLVLVLSALSLFDEKLMRFLDLRRDKGRDDYPVRPMWKYEIPLAFEVDVASSNDMTHLTPLVEDLEKRHMEMRLTLALVVMLSMALGRIQIGQADKMRSLVAPIERAA